MTLTIQGLGACQEVGRSAIHILTADSQLLFDFGINVQTGDVPFEPTNSSWIHQLDGMFLSHAHLDHSGYIPTLYRRGYRGHVYATPLTHDLCSFLLRDSLKVQEKKGETPQFLTKDIVTYEHQRKNTQYQESLSFGQTTVENFPAGHVPGAMMSLIDTGSKRVLYTGDVKFIDTFLVRGAYKQFRDIDLLICETTYPHEDHRDREQLITELKQKVQDTYNAGGTIMIPAFAVGRTQEMLLILDELDIPITLDGMGIMATKIILNHPDTLHFPDRLKKAFGKAHKISRQSQRHRVVREPGIIISTAGMLNGGPINFYIKKLYKQEKSILILTGFQCDDTVGQILRDTGRYVNDGVDLRPKFSIDFMNFSAHTDRSHLLSFFKSVNPDTIMLVHGDQNPTFAKELETKGFHAIAPRLHETVSVD